MNVNIQGNGLKDFIISPGYLTTQKGDASTCPVTAQSCSSLPAARPSLPVTQETVTITDLTVAAYPNPFTDRIKFSISSPVSGEASLDIYSITGQNCILLTRDMYLPVMHRRSTANFHLQQKER